MINFNKLINLLVVTSDIAFGELIRQDLEEMGRFHVHIAGDKRSAVSYMEQVDCPLAFLDTCLDGRDLLKIGILVHQINPNLRLVVISEAGGPTSALRDLSPEDYLSKPYHLPDLLQMMDSLFPSPHPPHTNPATGESDNDPPWISDVTRAAQHLTRLTLESSAQAALITRDDQLWAYAGQLPQSSTPELTETVLRYWNRQKENNLVRFIHLTSTGAEHMLYATRLTGNMVLALIFNAETPFGTIHTQAIQLVQSLANSPSEKQNDLTETDEDTSLASKSDPQSNNPLPNPRVDVKSLGLKYLNESITAIQTGEQESTSNAEPAVDLVETVESPAITWKSKFKKNTAEQDELGEERPNLLGKSARRIVLEPVSASVYNLDYACLLVPRFPHHHLIGDLSDRLADWLYETCIAFAWRLEFISVRPDYLLWIVNVPPPTSPAYLMRIKRQRTSEKIFDDFPRYKKENPSGDFWAPGYLIMGGSHPPPVQLIKEFIAQTRQRQGIPLQLR
jgi:REP element-mobilizing transposase RayT/CheY-like chemotaxis protein